MLMERLASTSTTLATRVVHVTLALYLCHSGPLRVSQSDTAVRALLIFPLQRKDSAISFLAGQLEIAGRDRVINCI